MTRSSLHGCLYNQARSHEKLCSIFVEDFSVLASRRLAMDFSLWLHSSDFQAVLTEPLPSNVHIRHNIVHKEIVCRATAATIRPLVKENSRLFIFLP